ncbi:two-component response regulator 24-like [Silene latifolia]|uniref:two-component response regulator 24-like n=1 Tax=Silene latifolia TaxID=37657 RepID=UPI003D77D3A5
MSGDNAMNVREKHSALIVDDTAVLRNLEQQMLRKHGFKTILAENGKEAVEFFIAGNTCDIVLMDMEMPVMDGIQATKELRAMGVKSLIFGITASNSKSDIQAFIEAGLDEYIEKPLCNWKLDRMLKRVL